MTIAKAARPANGSPAGGRPAGRTTGIGSLPHHNVDAALEHSFRMAIPFLPQIPIRNPWEFMIAQALEGLPGLQVEKDGAVSLDAAVWSGRARAFQERLGEAFDSGKLESFEPSAATSSCWQPFLWELEERGTETAKIQLAGPMTCQWALKLKDGTPVEAIEGLGSQIFRLTLARAIAMSRRLKAAGVRPIVFLDEPGLYALSLKLPRHVLALQELRLVVQALRKEGAEVGIHCCSDTDWPTLLGLGADIVSIDASLSLKRVLAFPEDVRALLGRGGRFALGVVPTAKSPEELRALSARALLEELLGTVAGSWAGPTEWAARLLSEALLTPACGLALHPADAAEAVVSVLLEFESLYGQMAGPNR